MVGNNKVVFCSFRKGEYPNLGVGYLVANLRKHGFDWDYQYLETTADLADCANQVAKIKPRVVCLTATSSDFNAVISLSKKIKSKCDVLLMLGGSHVTSVPQTLPRSVDIGFLGESEEIIVDIFNLIENDSISSENLRDISGITFFDDNDNLQINERRAFPKSLDNFPMPARDIFGKYYWKKGVTSILTSRGCPYNCSFCQVSTEWRVCRYHSAEYVVKEIKELFNNYGIHTFGVIDDLFIANKKRIRGIIENLRQEGLLGKIRFAVNGRSNLIDRELLELLIEMNIAEIALGLESMSPRILSLLKDKVTIEDNLKAIDLIYEYGLKVGGLFMIGTPTETIEDMAATYDYVAKNRYKFGGMQVCITTPLPNTRLWDLCVEYGRIDPDINKVEWDKLNIAAENIDTNLYVGDLDIDTFLKVLRKFRKLFFNTNFVEYENSNYIEAGNNESATLIQGNYPTEEWPVGKVFWTNGYLEAVVCPEGDEDIIALEFLAGKKKDDSEEYSLKLMLIDNQNKTEIFSNCFTVRNNRWCVKEFDIPTLKNVQSLKIVLESDYFYPKDFSSSQDKRKLSIAIRRIFLRHVVPLLPLNDKRKKMLIGPLGVAVKKVFLRKFMPLVPLYTRVRRIIRADDGLLSNFYEDNVWTKGEGLIHNISYEVKEKDTQIALCTKGWHPYKGDIARLNLNLVVNGVEQEFSRNDGNVYYFSLNKDLKVISEIKIVSSTFNPKKLSISDDSRELGIDFDCIKIL